MNPAEIKHIRLKKKKKNQRKIFLFNLKKIDLKSCLIHKRSNDMSSGFQVKKMLIDD